MPKVIELVQDKDGVYKPAGVSNTRQRPVPKAKTKPVFQKHEPRITPLQEFFNGIMEGLETLQQIESQIRRFR